MPLLLAVVALVVVLTAGALEVGARRQSLRAPEGAANRVPDVYELAYLAGGPERHTVTVIEALARGRIISIDGKGRVSLREGGGRAAADAGGGGLVPVHPSLAAAVDVLADRGGVAPLDRLAERLRHTSAMAELAARRRWPGRDRRHAVRQCGRCRGRRCRGGCRSWRVAWRPAERPDETIAETTPPIPSSRFPTGYSGLRRICLCAVPALSSVS